MCVCLGASISRCTLFGTCVPVCDVSHPLGIFSEMLIRIPWEYHPPLLLFFYANMRISLWTLLPFFLHPPLFSSAFCLPSSATVVPLWRGRSKPFAFCTVDLGTSGPYRPLFYQSTICQFSLDLCVKLR